MRAHALKPFKIDLTACVCVCVWALFTLHWMVNAQENTHNIYDEKDRVENRK